MAIPDDAVVDHSSALIYWEDLQRAIQTAFNRVEPDFTEHILDVLDSPKLDNQSEAGQFQWEVSESGDRRMKIKLLQPGQTWVEGNLCLSVQISFQPTDAIEVASSPAGELAAENPTAENPTAGEPTIAAELAARNSGLGTLAVVAENSAIAPESAAEDPATAEIKAENSTTADREAANPAAADNPAIPSRLALNIEESSHAKISIEVEADLVAQPVQSAKPVQPAKPVQSAKPANSETANSETTNAETARTKPQTAAAPSTIEIQPTIEINHTEPRVTPAAQTGAATPAETESTTALATASEPEPHTLAAPIDPHSIDRPINQPEATTEATTEPTTEPTTTASSSPVRSRPKAKGFGDSSPQPHAQLLDTAPDRQPASSSRSIESQSSRLSPTHLAQILRPTLSHQTNASPNLTTSLTSPPSNSSLLKLQRDYQARTQPARSQPPQPPQPNPDL